MKKYGIAILLLSLSAIPVLAGHSPWNNIKGIYHYNSIQKYDLATELLDTLDLSRLNKNQRNEIAEHLVNFGNFYYQKGMDKRAEIFYKKVITLSPKYWYLYNYLETIRRKGESSLFNIKYLFNQIGSLFNHFETLFILASNMFSVLFFSVIFIFSLMAFVFSLKYLKIAGSDIFIDEKGKVSHKNMIILTLLLLWPLVFMSGWIMYPFLLLGIIWVYLKEKEKKIIKLVFITILIISVLYSFSLLLENNIAKDKFRTIQKVYGGHLYKENVYRDFDDDLKIIQAYSYYKNKQYNTAQAILNNTGDLIPNKLKYDLLGNIYFMNSDYKRSQTSFIKSLEIDDKDPIILNNLTMVLLKEKNPKVLDSYAERFPEIANLRKLVTELKEPNFSRDSIIKRVFNISGEGFDIFGLIKGLFLEYIKLPFIYLFLLFFLYFYFIKRIFPRYGESIRCSKCSKIIKKSKVHKSYDLCEECYQLFFIKDVIFLEAKAIKEKEVSRKNRRKLVVVLLASLFVPGLNLFFKKKLKLFFVLAMIFYFLIGFSLINIMVFNKLFNLAPLFLYLLAIIGIAFYFIVNSFSIKGEEDGF